MRKVILKMHVSLDGFVARPDGDLDWFRDSFDDELTAWEVEGLWQAGVHIMGRATHHDMAAHWPNSTEPFARPMNELPKVVFSKTLEETEWEGSRVADGDLTEEISRLREEPGKDILAHGGASFAQLKLLNAKAFSSGVLALSYDRATVQARVNHRVPRLRRHV